MKRTRHHRTQNLVRPADVAAVGFAVASPGPGTMRLIIERERGGTWKVVDDSDLRGIAEHSLQQAISISAAVICGANLIGRLVTELGIDDEVRWVSVSRPANWGADSSDISIP